ncbi:MAG: hypothetical protein ACYCUG_03550 [Acidimicrobiales bacterium]
MKDVDLTDPDLLAEVSQRVAECYGRADLVSIASVGITQRVWRNTPVEDAHAGSGLARISDGEMFAANVAVTRLVADHLGDPIDWDGLRAVLVNRDLRLGGRTQGDLLGELWEEWSATALGVLNYQQELYEKLGQQQYLRLAAFMAWSARWWGMPRWADQVEAFRR